MAQEIIFGLQIYLALGLVVAIWFAARAHRALGTRVSLPARVVTAAGAVLLWPLVVPRLLRGAPMEAKA